MPKESLKDKLEGNELDLSLSNLTAVPVKEIAAIPKGTRLDLSCNLLTTITPEFCMLTHLVKIDLSKNHLTSLPDGFGSLQRLQHLDLYNNKLQTVPVSFCYLKNLKWLDLKDNPLLEPIARVAGDCLDEIQCKTCAKNVISYMKQVQSEEERQKQKLLQKERELEAARKIEEDKEKERKKAEKKAEKERRRKEYEANQAEKRQKEEAVDKSAQQENLETGVKKNGMKAESKYKKKTGLSCCGVLFSVLLGLVAILVGLYFYCETAKSDKFCQSTRVIVENYVKLAKKTLHQYTKTK